MVVWILVVDIDCHISEIGVMRVMCPEMFLALALVSYVFLFVWMVVPPHVKAAEKTTAQREREREKQIVKTELTLNRHIDIQIKTVFGLILQVWQKTT